MAFINYTIVPEDGVVVIDGQVAPGVNMTGIPADVHAIQWYGLRGSGTIEYKVDPITGDLPAPGSFTDAGIYSAQTTSAEAIIYAANNPVTYYSIVNGNVYQGITYNLGDPIVIDTPNTPQPAQTTTEVPGVVSANYQALYWFNDAWLVSSVDPTLSLSEAKNVLNTSIASYGALAGATQARIYSPVQLHTAVDVNLLPSADYAGMDLGEYQTYLDGQVSMLQGIVNSATSASQLYSINPRVDGNPNP
jgi:hypothetical protein